MRLVYVEDKDMWTAKFHALSQTQLAALGVSLLLSEVQGLISQLDYALGGAPSGLDRMLIDQCRSAAKDLRSAQSALGNAAGSIDRLETGEWEWVLDETENGG